jgi:CelD/BcsL family acetyltransferase involved in cellulose biosynthesis
VTLDVSYTRSLDGVDALEWRRLAERAGHVFATREWLLTWWRHFGKAARPLVGLARSDGELQVIVPMYAWWRRGLPVLRFVGHGASDRLGPICGPLSEPATAAAVAETLRGLPLRRFVLVGERVAREQRFGQVTGARFLYREANPILQLAQGSWDEFLRARSRNFRAQVASFPRRLSEQGVVTFRLASDPDRLEPDLETLFRLHRQRWDNPASPFLLAAAFHRDFAAQAQREGWLRLWFLEIDGRPAAALYGFRFAGSEAFYQGGRDPSFKSVGFVLLAHALQHAVSEGVTSFSLLRGTSAFKERFANGDAGLETFAIHRGVPARILVAAATAARGRSLGARRVLDRL